MKFLFFLLSFSLLTLTSFTNKPDTRYYEMRIYYCHPGKLNDLITRFTNHTTKFFEKHGMENVGYWIPTDNNENALYYILAYPSKAARETSWTAFRNDPGWQEVARKSEENGKIVARVSSTFMTASELSPAIQASATGSDRSFELRTYYYTASKLPELTKRFNDHAFGFFKKYGMQNIGYWLTENTATTQPALLYMLAYKSEEEGKKAWADFMKDPQWIKARTESEKNGRLIDSVKSVYLKPLAFSTIK